MGWHEPKNIQTLLIIKKEKLKTSKPVLPITSNLVTKDLHQFYDDKPI